MNRLTVLLMVLALLCGMRVEMWRESYGTASADHKNEVAVGHDNARTQTRTTAAATRIQAVAAGSSSLQNRIQDFKPAARAGTGDTHAASATCPALVPLSPWADPGFRVLYDAGSDPAGSTGQADHVPAAGTGATPISAR
ncbi:MAG TPA: hypothetical protein VGH91_04385 [Gammaproteobacteria bacterium]|jgi:hypothetical protein